MYPYWGAKLTKYWFNNLKNIDNNDIKVRLKFNKTYHLFDGILVRSDSAIIPFLLRGYFEGLPKFWLLNKNETVIATKSRRNQKYFPK